MTENRKKRGLGLKGLKPYYIIIGIIIILLCIILIILKNAGSAEYQVSEFEYTAEPTDKVVPKQEEIPDGKTDSVIENTAGIPEKPDVVYSPELVFIIDDVGNSIAQLKAFLEIPFPVTFAVMPDRRYTRECAEMIKAAGKEYILHQPMEAVGGADPGKSAIYTGMTDKEIKAVLAHNFKQLPDANGMNNHMGSAATTDTAVMNSVMEYLSENNLFFLDSFTVSNSLGKESAASHEVQYMKRNSMFLDNEKDHESIQKAINEGKKTAGKNGHAVMIGHVMSGELAELMLELYPNFIEDGFSLKEISELYLEMNSAITDEN